MNQPELHVLIGMIPTDATELIVKGRSTKEVFFTMPKEWKPSDDLKERITYAPPSMTYSKKGEGRNGNRWRIS